MKGNPFKYILLAAINALLLMMPSVTPADVEQRTTGPPPVEQQLIREGEFAIKLVSALGVSVVDGEAEAESRLAELGIAPRNGWIADYPVTPDISGELRIAVADAADAGKLSMNRDEALRVFDDVLAGLGLPLAPYTGETSYDSPPPTTETYYQDPAVINNYYDTVGPPVVTYYTPPPAYYYLYAWVPYPFWTTGFLFPGFFVLYDFHRTVFVHHRTVFVSNHFKDGRTNRFFRVDPVARFKGDSFVVRRGHDSRAYYSGQIRKSDRKFSDGQRTRSLREGRTLSERSQNNRIVSQPPGDSSRTIRQYYERTRNFTSTSPNVRSFNRNLGGSGGNTRQHLDRTRSFTPASPNVRSFNRTSGGSGREARQQINRTSSFTPSSQGTRTFSRPSSWSGSTNMRSGGARTFSPAGRVGGNFHGGRGRR